MRKWSIFLIIAVLALTIALVSIISNDPAPIPEEDEPDSPPVSEVLPEMVQINGVLYQTTGQESAITGRCGNMDGEITAAVDNTQRPTEDNTSNFGTGYGYQFCGDHVELQIDGKWIVFDPVPDSAR